MSDVKGWQMGVGPGWARLVEQAVKVADNYKARIKRIYAKDGELHVEIEGPINNKGRMLLNFLMVKSHKICEECGNPGKTVRVQRRVATLCEKHALEESYE